MTGRLKRKERACVRLDDETGTFAAWASLAIFGRLREADAVASSHESTIRHVASRLRATCPFAARPLWRGLLLDGPPRTGVDPADYPIGSWSFSEDRGCALWFASPSASVAEVVVALRPRSRGYLVRVDDPAAVGSEVLFHHSWAGPLELVKCARHARHPLIDAEQLEWALRTQSEVVLSPPRGRVAVELVVGELSAAELEGRYGPPWLAVGRSS